MSRKAGTASGDGDFTLLVNEGSAGAACSDGSSSGIEGSELLLVLLYERCVLRDVGAELWLSETKVRGYKVETCKTQLTQLRTQ